MNNAIRNGNFTSSTIYPLTTWNKKHDGPGAPFYTYIKHKNMERRLGRSLNADFNSKPTAWGNLCEGIVHELLGTDYKFQSNETLTHPTISCWRGSPDHIRTHKIKSEEAVCDAKCPKTLLSFCEIVDAWEKGGIEAIRNDTEYGDKWYWQIVSNACITGKSYGELIVYCPYKEELDTIRKACEGKPDYYWLTFAQDDELPYLIKGGHYKNLNVLRFPIPAEDKIFLHNRVVLAEKDLIETKPLKLAA